MTASENVRFGAFTLDLSRGTLTHADGEVFLRPKAYTLLTHLARNQGRVVSKAELMEVAWPNVHVTEDSLTNAIREIRKAMGANGAELLRTAAKRGYMLNAGAEPAPEWTQQPVVAVLRFRNDSANRTEQDDSIIDGFAEDLIGLLARSGSVTVLARTSSFDFASYAQAEWSSVAARIGADYVVEGSVRRVDNRAYISVNLVEAAKAIQLWGERYEAVDVGLFTIQQEIGEQIVTRLVSRLDEATVRRAIVKPAANLSAYELVIRGAKALRIAMGTPASKDARVLFEQAIARDSDYGLPYAYLALEAIIAGGLGRTPPEILKSARHHAERCIDLSPEQSIGHRVMSLVRTYQREHAGAEEDLRLSLSLNPCDADAVEQMGVLMILRGRPVEAIRWIEKAVRLNPLHPQWYNFDRGLALFVLGDYGEAVEVLERSHAFLAWTPMLLAACYARLGNREAAGIAARNISKVNPKFEALDQARGAIAFENASDIEHLVESVELALSLR